MQSIFGVVTNGVLTDTSKTLHGAKVYATRKGYNHIGKRTGYNVVKEWKRTNGKWKQIEF